MVDTIIAVYHYDNYDHINASTYRDATSIQWYINRDYMLSCCASLSSGGPAERVYDSYVQLPDLFDIEVRTSPTGDNVTLYINGTNRSNNVTIVCGNVDLSLGTSLSNILFTLILEFVGKFNNHHNQFCTLYIA